MRVRRSVSRWAPQPSFSPRSLAMERMYVPEEQAIENESRPASSAPKSRSRHPDLLRNRGHALAAARHLVELPPADLLRRIRRRGLEELAPERFGLPLDRLACHRGGVPVLADALALAVVRRRRPAETDRALVRLVHQREEALEARGAAGAEKQEAGGHGVERAAVADAGDAGRRANALHDVVRGQLLGLVEEKEEALLERIRGSHDSRSSLCSSSSGGRTCWRSSSIRAPRSSEWSDTKWSSGA